MENIWKTVTREKVRFETSKGLLTAERLFELNLDELKATIIDYNNKIKPDIDKDILDFFDDEIETVNDTVKLSLEILKDVYTTKKNEMNVEIERIKNKKHNMKIMALISKKEEDSLENLSIDELKSMLK